MFDSGKNYDVLVVGGGNAALGAAITAARAGAKVLLAEHAPRAMRGGAAAGAALEDARAESRHERDGEEEVSTHGQGRGECHRT